MADIFSHLEFTRETIYQAFHVFCTVDQIEKEPKNTQKHKIHNEIISKKLKPQTYLYPNTNDNFL